MSTLQDFCEMACNSCGDNFPAAGISRSMMYFGMIVSPLMNLWLRRRQSGDQPAVALLQLGRHVLQRKSQWMSRITQGEDAGTRQRHHFVRMRQDRRHFRAIRSFDKGLDSRGIKSGGHLIDYQQ